MTVLGTITLWLSLLMGAWAIVIGLLGEKWRREELVESSRRAAVVLAPLLAVAVLSLVATLLRRDLNVAYVSDNVSLNLSTTFTVAALLAGWNGFALVTIGAFATLAIPSLARSRPHHSAVYGVSVLVLLGVAVLLLAGDPFRRLGVTPIDGHGLDPLLLGPVLVLERPLSVLGYAALGMILPLRLARSGDRSLQQWLSLGWLLLVASLAIGLWQAYRFSVSGGGLQWSTSRSVVASTWTAASLALLFSDLTRGTGLGERLRSPAPLAMLAGLVLFAIGSAAGRAGPTRDVRVKAGASTSIPSMLGADYRLTHMGVSRFQMAERVTAAATMEVSRGEAPLGLITSDKRQYFGLLGQPIEAPVITAGVRRGLLEDVRVVFQEAATNEEARYHVRVVPLASLVWVGIGLLIFGGLLRTLGLAD